MEYTARNRESQLGHALSADCQIGDRPPPHAVGVELIRSLESIVVSDLRPGDVQTVAAIFAGLSPDSRYLRFGGPLPRLTPAMLARLADVHPGRHQAHVATVADRPVGLIRWVRYDQRPGLADLAVEVIDTHRRRAVGWRLLGAALDSAASAGIRAFVPYVLDDNRAVQRWARALGATRGPQPGELSLPLDTLRQWLTGRLDPSAPGRAGSVTTRASTGQGDRTGRTATRTARPR